MAEGKILAVASQKGGVGKTTLALNAAYAFAKRGWKVLLVDVDPQGSIGSSIAGDLEGHPGLAEVLSGDARLSDALITTRLPELSILGVGTVAPSKTPEWSASLEDGGSLARVFAATKIDYDLILVDTPPAVSGCTYGTLRAADSVIVPLQAEPLAARSVGRFLELLRELRDKGRAAELAGLVVTMLQTRSDSSLAVAQESWKIFPENLVLEVSIPRDDRFLQASAHGVPLGLLSRRPPAVATIFERLAAELEPRVGLPMESDDEGPIPLLD